MSDKYATAHWQGNLKDGKGSITSETGVLSDTPYGFKARFESGPGTNPEELVAAAHAGCFTMAVSAQFAEAGLAAESLDTRATVTLDKVSDGFSVTKVHLDLSVRLPGADEQKLLGLIEKAKVGCPISKLLKAEITLTTKFLA